MTLEYGVFNPAVWFSMSIWGQTHVFSLFFVLAALLLAEHRLPFWAWLALALGCLTRPQMAVFGLLIGIFLLLVPFTLPTSASLPVDILYNNFHVQEGTGNTASLNTVSQTAYSIWPLITYVQFGAIGTDRPFAELDHLDRLVLIPAREPGLDARIPACDQRRADTPAPLGFRLRRAHPIGRVGDRLIL